MSKNCDIVKDLLPLYVEDLTSEKSNLFIEEHIATCGECANYFENIKKEIPTVEESIDMEDYDDQIVIKNIKKRLMSQRFITVAIGVIVGLIVSMNYFPWASIGLIGFILFIGAIVYILY